MRENDDMRKQQPVTQAINVSDVRKNLGEILNQIFRRETRVLVMKSGIPVAGIVSGENFRRLERLDQERAERFRVIDEMRATIHDVPAEEVKQEAARSLAAMRAER
jgi:antitoxin (DNA-binding transcriptional repressor) of toxin-antitoxin stability system